VLLSTYENLALPHKLALAPAHAQWGSSSILSQNGSSAYDQDVAVSANGNTTLVVWQWFDGSNFRVQAVVGSISGGSITWGSVSNISSAGFNASNPRAAISADGSQAIVILRRSDGANNLIYGTTASISGNTPTWSAEAAISPAGFNARLPTVALSSNGALSTTTWELYNGANYIIQTASATIAANAATWGTVSDISAVGQTASRPRITLASDGAKATIIWTRSNGSNTIVQTASATISGSTASWSAPSDMSAAGFNAFTAQIALSADGTKATTVWTFNNGTNDIIQARSATISGNTATWGVTTTALTSTNSSADPEVALSSDGTMATAVWYRDNGTNAIVQSASATIAGATATWGTVSDLSASGIDSYTPSVSLSADGQLALSLWILFDGTNSILQSAYSVVSGNSAAWSTSSTLSLAGEDVSFTDKRVVLDSAGNVGVGCWTEFDGNDFLTNAAIFNPPAPTPTPTPIPTSTATAMPTPSATPTSVPTNTATYTPTPNTTPTIPNPSVTATPTPFTAPAKPTIDPTELVEGPINAEGRVEGSVFSEVIFPGSFEVRRIPVPDVTIILSLQQNSSQLSSLNQNFSRSAITDSNGKFVFTGVPKGTFLLKPADNSFAFDPPTVTAQNGFRSSPVQAYPVDLNDDGCQRNSFGSRINGVNKRVQRQIRFATNEVTRFTKAGAKLPGGAALAASLQRVLARIESTSAVLHAAEAALPKVTLQCNGKSGCVASSSKSEVRTYLDAINSLRRYTFFILRRSRDVIGADLVKRSHSSRTLRLHRGARSAAASKLPRTTDVCSL